MSDLAIFSSIEKLMNKKANLMKRASDGLNSSTPDDPTGDGTVEPTTGDLYDRMNKDLDDPIVDINATDEDQANTDSPDANLGNIGTDVYESDETLVDDYNMDVPDPGTDSPMKTSSYKYASMSLDQHNRAFRKVASILMQDMRERASFSKQASYNPVINNTNQLQDWARKNDLIVKTAEADAERYCTNYAHQLQKMAEGEDVGLDDIPVETISDTLAEGTPELTDEEALALSDIPPEVLEALVETPEPQLEQIEELANAVDAGQLEPDEAVAIITGEDTGSDSSDDSSDSDSDSDTTEKEAAYRQAYIMRKVAEEAPLAEGDVEAAAELPPEDLEAIESLPPEALEEIIALADAAEAGEVPPEAIVEALSDDPVVQDAIAAEGGDSSEEEIPADDVASEPTEEEASEEMANVLEDEGLTPSDLDAVAEGAEEVKSAKLRKIASCCRRARIGGKKPRKKSARALVIRNHCKRALYEILN